MFRFSFYKSVRDTGYALKECETRIIILDVGRQGSERIYDKHIVENFTTLQKIYL
jgi:hypothetical protein